MLNIPPHKYAKLILLSISLCLVFPHILQAGLTLSDQLLDKIEAKYKRFGRERVVNWENLINKPMTGVSDENKLEMVNDFFNSTVQFMSDKALWNKEDYWATPLEFLSVGAGDCEDYAIAKYFTLVEMGMDQAKLRLTYVKAIKLGQAHMVLTYYKNKRAIPLVLDNLITEIKPANLRTDLVPVYSFNGDGLWIAKTRGEGQRVGSSSRLSLWEDLKKRMENSQN